MWRQIKAFDILIKRKWSVIVMVLCGGGGRVMLLDE